MSEPRLQAHTLNLAYGGQNAVVEDLTLALPDGAITTIIGPNGCGKSTLLRALARLLAPRHGAVLLDGQHIHRLPTKEVARRLGLLPQQPAAIEAITVEDLTRRGRYPHQGFFQPPSRADQAAVEHALDLAGMTALRDRPVDELSGGQRQRAWIAMALAQETALLLLDEPTTYLDLAHQQEVLALLRRLNRETGRTLALVLHDVNDAAQVSDHVVAMRAGRLVAEGDPATVLQPALLAELFGITCDVVLHPHTSAPIAVPRSRTTADPDRRASAPHPGGALRAERLSVGYGARRAVNEVSVTFPAGRVTALIGPNASGKSTLLRACARLLPALGGAAHLADRPVLAGPHRQLARQMALLAQGGNPPAGVTVEDLVAIGRTPHQTWYRQWSAADQQAVDRALAATGLTDLRYRPVDTLSGGQQQRVWLALALAQHTSVLLLDEPTTFLDLAHQIEVLDLARELNQTEGRTVVLALHDLGLACRYADYLVVMQSGRIAAAGPPAEVLTPQLVREVFGLECCLVADPITGTPIVLPLAGGERGAPDAQPAPAAYAPTPSPEPSVRRVFPAE